MWWTYITRDGRAQGREAFRESSTIPAWGYTGARFGAASRFRNGYYVEVITAISPHVHQLSMKRWHGKLQASRSCTLGYECTLSMRSIAKSYIHTSYIHRKLQYRNLIRLHLHCIDIKRSLLITTLRVSYAKVPIDLIFDSDDSSLTLENDRIRKFD